MYQRIMVPLDGSKLAECVLPHVEDLAKGCGTDEVILVSVIERIIGHQPLTQHTRPVDPLPGYTPVPPPEAVTDVPVAVGKKQRQSQRYLSGIAKRLEKKGIKVRTEVLLGHPAEEIAHYGEHNDCNLITMASHGRSGVSRWAYGSVADKVFRASSVPVLMVKAPGHIPGV